MSRSELELLADAILRYLREEGATRIDEDTVGDYRTVFQICDQFRIDPSTWRKAKTILNEWGQGEGYSIVYIQGRGHFVGWAGEEITNDVAKFKIANGWVKTLKTSAEKIKRCNPRQQRWIEKRYNDFSVEKEYAEDVETAIRA